jgi:hypothetical protein
MKSWITIQEYATKYGVSISTLRRRIKSKSIQFRFDDGKYFLEEPSSGLTQAKVLTPDFPVHAVTGQRQALAFVEAPALDPVNEDRVERVLEELRKSYDVLLKEKDEQILQLRGQVADLQTLVQALETENERLTKTAKTQPVAFVAQDPLSQFYMSEPIDRE